MMNSRTVFILVTVIGASLQQDQKAVTQGVNIVTSISETAGGQLAAIIDIEPTALEYTSKVWNNIQDSVFSRGVIVMTYDESGPRDGLRTKNPNELFSFFNKFMKSRDTEEISIRPGGVPFYSILKLSEEIPFGSVIMLFTDRRGFDEDLAQLAANTLRIKGCKLYVLWYSQADNGSGALLKDVAKYSHGEFYALNTDIYEERPEKDTSFENQQIIQVTLDPDATELHINFSKPIKNLLLSDISGTMVLNLLSPSQLINKYFHHNSTEIIVDTSSLKPGDWKIITEKDLVLGKNIYTTKKINIRKDAEELNPVNGSYQGLMSEINEQFGPPGQIIPLPPITIEVSQNSQLYVIPGQTGDIKFTVTNHFSSQQQFQFSFIADRQIVRGLTPPSTVIGPGLTKDVTLIVQMPANVPPRTEFKVTVLVRGTTGQAARSAIISSYERRDDNNKPAASYHFYGNCRDYSGPCENQRWRLKAEFQDGQSGLLYVTSYPPGLSFGEEFVAGTRSLIHGYYTSNCCYKKVSILARDLKGNHFRHDLDVNNQFINLSTGEIAAIVLGVILVIAIIIIIIVVIIKKKKDISVSFSSHSPH